MKLGSTFTLTYSVTLPAGGELGLGAALYDSAGHDQADGTGDEDSVSFAAGTASNTRAVHIPTSVQPGVYEVDGELWPANFIGDGNPYMSGSCGLITVTS